MRLKYERLKCVSKVFRNIQIPGGAGIHLPPSLVGMG